MNSLFRFGRRETPALQVYGKLPLAKDYLRLGMAEGGARRFREWLDQAYSTAGARLAWPARFVLGDAWGQPLQGLAWPSTDAGQKRPFPFALCVERKRGSLARDVDLAFATAEGVWRRLAGAYVDALEQADGQAAIAALRGRTIEVERHDAELVERLDLEQWLAALWPDAGDEGFFRDLERLGSVARDGSNSPLRLPVVDNLPVRPQAQIWLETLRRLALLDGDAIPTLFLPVAGRRGDDAKVGGFVTFFRRLPTPEEVAWLADPRDVGSQGPGDLCDGQPRLLAKRVPASENVPPLGDSVRGMVVRFAARSRGDAG